MMTLLINMLMISGISNTQLNTVQCTALPGDLTEVTYLDADGHVLQHGYMINGEKTGEWTSYDAKGRVTARAYFSNGHKEGKWKVFNEQGELTYKILYKNDEKVWAIKYSDGNRTEVAVR